jgi:hypothetical protein
MQCEQGVGTDVWQEGLLMYFQKLPEVKRFPNPETSPLSNKKTRLIPPIVFPGQGVGAQVARG